MNPPFGDVAGDALWPVRLADAFGRLRAARDSEDCRRACEHLWTLLYFGLLRCARAVASRRGMREIPDLEDVASKKSLDLLRRAESGALDLSGRKPTEVVAFLSTVARNGLLDLKRKEARSPVLNLDPDSRPPSATDFRWRLTPFTPAPNEVVESRDFGRALRACVETMPARSMRIWFFRVFLEMSSREIALHPEVNLNPEHVDVVLYQSRAAVKACMEKKGQFMHDLPPGAFAELWELFCGWRARSTSPEFSAIGGLGSGPGKPPWPPAADGSENGI